MNGEHSNAPAPLATDPVSHTPGPWIAAAGPSSIVGWPVVGPRGRAITTVHYLRGDTPEGKRVNAEAGANACLIAAAPDLLALAKQYAGECAECEGTGTARYDCGGDALIPTDCNACADIRAAIDKAEGRS
jgi:hypothetical protein